MEVAVLVITVFTALLIVLMAAAYTCNRYVCIGVCDGGGGSDSADSLQNVESVAASENDVTANCTTTTSSSGDRQAFEIAGEADDNDAAAEAVADDDDDDDDVAGTIVKFRVRSRGYQQCPTDVDDGGRQQHCHSNSVGVEESLL